MRWLYLSYAFLPLAAAKTCYVPDGSVNPDAYATNNETEFSSCCQAPQESFTNGLCKSPGDAQINWFWRVGCTDPTFEDPSCPKFCEQFGDDEWVTNQCDATTFCCSIKANEGDPVYIRSNYTCCQNSAATFQLPELVHQSGPVVYKSGLWLVENPAFFVNGPLSSATPSASVAATSVATSGADEPTNTAEANPSADAAATPASPSGSTAGVIANPSQTDSSQSSSSSSSNKTALGVGLGVGIPLGIALIAGLAFLGWRHHRKHYQRRDSAEAGLAAAGTGAAANEKPYSPYQQQQQQYQQPSPNAGYPPTYPPAQNGYYAAPKVGAVAEGHAQPVYEMHDGSHRHEVDGAHPVWKRT